MSPLERWAFLLLNADRIDADELRRLLLAPEFQESLGVLEMITRTPATRELYDARLKAKLDEEARLDFARAEGEQIGQQRGEQIGQQRGEQIGQQRGEQIGQQHGEPIGQIRLLEQFLNMPPTASEELAKWSLDQLSARLADLQQIFRERKESCCQGATSRREAAAATAEASGPNASSGEARLGSLPESNRSEVAFNGVS